MFGNINNLKDNLSNIFDVVAIDDPELVVQRTNTATIFLGNIKPDPLTVSRERYTGGVSIMFSIPGTGFDPYSEADSKIKELRPFLEQSFSYYEISKIYVSYERKTRRLFIMLEINATWEEVI